MKAPRSFARTASALAVYDAAGEAMDAVTTENAEAVIEAWDAALAAVQEAFAADTLDINPNGVGTFRHLGHLVKFARKCAANKV